MKGEFKMCRMLLLAWGVVFLFGSARAGWETWQATPCLYGVSLQPYKAGDTLSDTGAVNGTWGKTLTDSEAVAVESAGSTYISVSTPEDVGISFTPSDGSEGYRSIKSLIMTMLVSGYETLPELTEGVRAALSISAPPSGHRSFVGWGWCESTQKFAWQELQLASGEDTLEDGWRNVSLRFAKDADGRIRVQYRIIPNGITGDTRYVVLVPTDAASTSPWLVAGGNTNQSVVCRVEFRGEGGFARFDGSEPRRGLASGIGNWYDNLFQETVLKHGTGDWSFEPSKQDDDYVVAIEDGADPLTFTPAKPRECAYSVTKLAVRFMSASDDDACPENPCARVRLVEDEKVEGVYRFACLANGGWYTNQMVEAHVSRPYTLEIGLDREHGKLTYVAREGYGAEAGTNMVLCADAAIDTTVLGCAKSIEFSGSGFVREVRGQKKSMTPQQ